MASGHKVGIGGGYYNAYSNAGGYHVVTNSSNRSDASQAAKGDVIQLNIPGNLEGFKNGMHTAFIVARNSNGTFDLVDSNFNLDLMVRFHKSWDAYGWASSHGLVVNIWRFGTVSPPPSPNPKTSDLRYVTNLYHDILGRGALAADITGAAQAIDNGSSRTQVANSFLTSQEYRTKLVAADYQQMLHRAVDASGSATFVTLLNNGAQNEDVLADLAASDEYFATRGGGTNSGFVNALYQDLVQRAADPSGLANWTQLLDSGAASRADVARGMIRSQEYRTKLVDGYYSHYLARAADSSGESNYVSVLTQGGTDESVIAGLVSSDEYYAKPS